MKFDEIYEELIEEGVTDIVYHAAPLPVAVTILKTDAIRGFDGISTTRSLSGNYHISNRMISVIFDLDGRMINQKYAGRPFGSETMVDDEESDDPFAYKFVMTGKSNGQQEDRIMVKRIPKIKSFIRRFHIHAPDYILNPLMQHNKRAYHTKDDFDRDYLEDLKSFDAVLSEIRKTGKDVMVHTGKVPNQYSGTRVSVNELRNKIKQIFDWRVMENTLTEAPLPPDWDQSMFTGRHGTYKQMIEYAKARAQQLGKGSSRVAFEVPYQGRRTVIKVALNQGKGLSQNQEEADLLSDYYVRDSGIVIPLIDYDERNPKPTWIHTEYADKITKKQLERFFDGIPIHRIISFIEYEKTGRKDWAFQPLPDSIHDNDSFDRLRDLLLNYTQIGSGDLTRNANWGIYKGKPVIIDLGFTENTMKLYQR